MNIYCVYEEGHEIFSGAMPDIVKKFEVSKGEVYRALRARKIGKEKVFKRKYDVQIVGQCYVQREKPKSNSADEPETPFDIAVWALKRYGNTSVDFDPLPKLLPDMLEIHGLDCRVKEVPNWESVKKRGRRPKHNVHWYVEVARAIQTSQSV